MLYNLIALGVIAFFLFLITWIIAKKFARLKTLDVGTIVEEKEARIKEKILVDRLKRRAEAGKKLIGRVASPSTKKVSGFWRGMKNKVVALEKKYQKESIKKSKGEGADFAEKVKRVLVEGEDLLKEEAYAEAEKKFIEVISLDSKSKRAYSCLSQLYIDQKEYQQAIQTLMYVLKLDLKQCSFPLLQHPNPKDPYAHAQHICENAQDITEDYVKLGEVSFNMGELNQALGYYQQALEQSSHNPKVIDCLIQTSLALKNRSLALDYYKKMEAVNPENQNLITYKKKIDEI